MAKENKPVTSTPVTTPVAATPAAPAPKLARTTEIVRSEIKAAFAKGDNTLADTLLAEYHKLKVEDDKAAAKAAEAARAKELEALTVDTAAVTAEFAAMVQKLTDLKVIKAAHQGIWIALDFGQPREKGINPVVRLVKIHKGAIGGSTGKGSYKALPGVSTASLLEKVGNEVMFKEDTAVTIDKVAHTIKAGTTFKAAYDYSSNGGWRNKVVMAVRKAAGVA